MSASGKRFVGFGQVDVFANHCNIDRVLRLLEGAHDLIPLLKICLWNLQAQLFDHNVVETFHVQHHGNFVDRVRIQGADHRALFNVSKKGNLATFGGR